MCLASFSENNCNVIELADSRCSRARVSPVGLLGFWLAYRDKLLLGNSENGITESLTLYTVANFRVRIRV